jgi:hypothetical protein
VPNHNGIEGNEQANQAAKCASSKPAGPGFEGISLAYIRRACTEARRVAVEECVKALQGAYDLQDATGLGTEQDGFEGPRAASEPLLLIEDRTRPYRHVPPPDQGRDSPECRGCGEAWETVQHVLFECRI